MNNRPLRIILFLMFSTAMPGQAVATFSMQPLEAFKAAFGSSLKGVALYNATVCNTGQANLILPEGLIIQAAETKFSVVNRALVSATILKAYRKNKLYRASVAVEWLAFTGGFLTAGTTVAASASIRVIFPILAGLSHRLSGTAAGDLPDPVAAYGRSFVDGDSSINLPANSCGARILLGTYRRDFVPFSSTVGGVP